MADLDIFSQNILSQYQSYISHYESYCKSFLNLISNVIYKDEDNSFSLQYKLFYGIIASSTMNNIELFKDFEEKFSQSNGDKSWIEQGIKCENIPKHIKLFYNMNDILAHKPWILHWTHFVEFDNGFSFFLFQSAIILTTIHRYVTIISALNLFLKNNIKLNDLINNDESDIERIKEIENKIKKKIIKKSEKNETRNEKEISSLKKNYIEEENKGNNNSNNNFFFKINKNFKKYFIN